MAFGGDCGASTVLEALRVAHAARFLVLVTSRGPRDEALRNSATPTVVSRLEMTGTLVVQASRLHVRPGRPHHKTTRMRLPFVVHVSRVQGGKSEIRNPKFRIRPASSLGFG